MWPGKKTSVPRYMRPNKPPDNRPFDEQYGHYQGAANGIENGDSGEDNIA
ncbi:hypothetical protein GCM10017044_18070 [Kordiimonas sediminis]|uniref:Uncharacterized protein n=1 Tax=Kordiimonas sediminis TaxID=1735581 RepID=A0A919ARP5_9PROT|nr:hypothetical protein GCM10017044_18070 [Kordiimonas sediminis]